MAASFPPEQANDFLSSSPQSNPYLLAERDMIGKRGMAQGAAAEKEGILMSISGTQTRKDYAEQEFAEHPEFSHIVGVFREQSPASEAALELREAGFGENQIRLTVFDPQTIQGAENTPLRAADKRFFVHVEARGREKKAVGILARHGANNADLPHGTELVNGRLVYTGIATPAGESALPTAPDTSFFGTEHSGSSVTDSIAKDPRGI